MEKGRDTRDVDGGSLITDIERRGGIDAVICSPH